MDRRDISNTESLRGRYIKIRKRSEEICSHLKTEDYSVQPVVDVSPPKWHLAHTTWFFESFLLTKYVIGYKEFDNKYSFLFNSYYQNVGERVNRHERGHITRPTVKEVYKFRSFVDEAMMRFFDDAENYPLEWEGIVELGLQHEQQHQELLFTDIKHILSLNPLSPVYTDTSPFINEKPEFTKEIEFEKLKKEIIK